MTDAIDRVAAAIVLFETQRIGPRHLRRRLARAEGPVTALAWAPRADPARARWDDPRVRREARERARRFIAAGGRLLVHGEPDFPARCAAFDWMPGVLYVRGAPGRDGGFTWPERIATIVGTRRARPSALAFTREVAARVAAQGIAVASGMALGIDAAAHRGALDAGGATLAVLGTGIDQCYPRAHLALMHAIGERGILVSELPPGTPPRAYQFPARNRILAALADAVLVVQAPERSGALITARHACEAGVEVLAAPGDPWLPETRGSNGLLGEGVRVMRDVDDLIAAVHGQERPELTEQEPVALPAHLDRSDRRLLGALDLEARSLEEVARTLGLDIAHAMQRAIRLELEGLVENLAGGRVRLTPLAARCDRQETS